MSISSITYPLRTYSRHASWRASFLLTSVGQSSEYSTDLTTDRLSYHERQSVLEGASDEALLDRCSWLEPLDNIMSSGTSEQWKNSFATIPAHDNHRLSEPFTSACIPMPPMPISDSMDPLVLDRDPRFEVTWAKDGSDMPRNWPAWYRGVILASISFGTLVV